MKQIGRGGSVSLGLPPNSSRLPELPIGLTRLHMEAMRPSDSVPSCQTLWEQGWAG